MDNDIASVADILASNYGLGGCRNIQEYIVALDEVDVDVVSSFMNAIVDRLDREYGDDNSTRLDDASTIRSHRVASGNSESGVNGMIMFLRDSGVGRDDAHSAIAEAKEKNYKYHSINHINSNTILRDDFDLKEALVILRENRENSINFNINAESISRGAWVDKTISKAKAQKQ